MIASLQAGIVSIIVNNKGDTNGQSPMVQTKHLKQEAHIAFRVYVYGCTTGICETRMYRLVSPPPAARNAMQLSKMIRVDGSEGVIGKSYLVHGFDIIYELRIMSVCKMYMFKKLQSVFFV